MEPDRGGKMAGAAREARKSGPAATPSFRPIAERGLDERQRRHRRRIGAQDSRAEAQAQDARSWRGSRPARRRRSRLRGRRGGRRRSPALTSPSASSGLACGASSSQKTMSRSGGQRASVFSSVSGAATSGAQITPHCSQASMRVGAQALEVDARDLGAPGDERPAIAARPSPPPSAPYSRGGRA